MADWLDQMKSYYSNEAKKYISPSLGDTTSVYKSDFSISGLEDQKKESLPQTNKGGLASFRGSDTGKGVLGAAGSLLGGLENMTFQNSRYANSKIGSQAHDVRSTISDAAIQSGNPMAMAIGAATKLVDGVMDITGMRSDTIDKNIANKAGIGEWARFFNNAMNFLPGNPLAFGGSALMDAEKSMDAENVRSAYTGTLSDMDAAETMGGGRVNFLLGGTRSKINNFIARMNDRNTMLTNISQTNTMRKQSDYGRDLAQQNTNRYSDNNYQGTAIGRTGLQLPSKEECLRVIRSKDGIKVFQNGGSILVPDGALHANLHHMEETNSELAEELTRKGIPIVVTDDEGNITQCAEVEKEEIIVEKSLTEKIEELWKKGDEDSMIKAGKLFTDALFTDSTDNTGLIEKVINEEK